MNKRFPKSIYLIIGILAGVAGLVLSVSLVSAGDSPLVSKLKNALIFAAIGVTVGYVRPERGWQWGIAMAFPLVALLALSVGFAGQFQAFLVHDLPVLVGVIAGGTIGGWLGAWSRQRRNTSSNQAMTTDRRV